MQDLYRLINELGISKVRLAKYLGVSRQMLYNYLALPSLEEWPKEKSVKLLSLLNIKSGEEIKDIDVNGEYIIEIENKLNENVKDTSNREVIADLKGFNKKKNKNFNKINDYNNLDKYIKENCAYGCKYFVLEKISEENNVK